MKTLGKVALFTVLHYTEQTDKESYNYEFTEKIRAAINRYLRFHKLTQEEADFIIEISKHERMQELTAIQIDYNIYAMELLTLWVEFIPKQERRSALNISDKKIMQAKAKMIMDMIKFKQTDQEKHAKVKEIIQDSQKAARAYFDYIKEQIEKRDQEQ